MVFLISLLALFVLSCGAKTTKDKNVTPINIVINLKIFFINVFNFITSFYILV